MAHFTPQPGDEHFCRGCIVCCAWPGDVLFEPSAVPAIAAHLAMDERACADRFFDLHDDRWHLRTKPGANGGCIFLSATGCTIYPHRPRQCRTFPYEWQRTERGHMRQCALYQALRRRRAASVKTVHHTS